MLSRRFRLRKNRQFRFVYARGRSRGTQLVTLVCIRSGPSAQLRVGFSVSKKVGNAVVRNRVKRRMSEALRPELDRLIPGQMMIFVARPPAAQASYWALRSDMLGLLRRSNLYRAQVNAP